MEGRRRVKDHLLRIDETFEEVAFEFTDRSTGDTQEVETLEFRQYPQLVTAYEEDEDGTDAGENEDDPSGAKSLSEVHQPELQDGLHIEIKENQKGVSYEKLFADYLRGATKIEIVDPYIRAYHQVRNVMEFCDMLLRTRPEGEEVTVSLVTGAPREDEKREEQTGFLDELKDSLDGTGVHFEYEVTWDGIHARSIKTDTGWKISLDRGLDIFQPPKNSFDLGRVNPEERRCKPFEVTYIRDESVSVGLE